MLFVIGLGLVIYFAEKLVKATVGTSLGLGISTFLISVIFIGFDPENLAVGLPVCLGTTIVISAFMMAKRLPRRGVLFLSV